MSLHLFSTSPSLKTIEITRLVLDNVDSNSKTWSLEIYDQVGDIAQSFKPNDTLYFVNELMKPFLIPSTQLSSRFKITQLFSLLHAKTILHFSESISPYKDQIMKLIDQMPNHPLNQAMKKHFNSIFEIKPTSSTPPPFVRSDFIHNLVPRQSESLGPRAYSQTFQ